MGPFKDVVISFGPSQLEIKENYKYNTNSKNKLNKKGNNNYKVVPYTKGLSESFKNTCIKYGI